MMEMLFVYGSLRRGCRLCGFYMERGRFIEEGFTEPEFELVSLSRTVPGLLSGGVNIVKGEVWELPKEDYDIVAEMEEAAGYMVRRHVITGISGERYHTNLFEFDPYKYIPTLTPLKGDFYVEFPK